MTWMRQLLEWQREVDCHRRVHRVGQAGHLPRPGLRVHPQGGHRGADRGFHAGGLRLQDTHRAGPPVHGRQGERPAGVSGHSSWRSGDTVEVVASKAERGPSLDWLNPNRGYVGSANARQKVRQWFRRQARSTNIQRGPGVASQGAASRLNERSRRRPKWWPSASTTDIDELLANLGSGVITESPSSPPPGAGPTGRRSARLELAQDFHAFLCPAPARG